jgi:hypothetical protein
MNRLCSPGIVALKIAKETLVVGRALLPVFVPATGRSARPTSATVISSVFLSWMGCSVVLLAAEPTAPDAELDRAFGQLQTLDWGQSHAPLGAIDEAILASRGDPALRRALEQRLAACLTTAAPVAAKQLVCRKLSLIGTEASVPALAALLADPELSHPARLALERIPGPAVDQALRAALPRADRRTKIGLINSLGMREDAEAAPALIGLLRDADAGLATAAAQALGKIGTPEAAPALRDFRAAAPPAVQAAATEAWIVAAERLARHGYRAAAAEIFRQLYRDATEQRWRRCAPQRGTPSRRPGTRQFACWRIGRPSKPRRICSNWPAPPTIPSGASWRSADTCDWARPTKCG